MLDIKRIREQKNEVEEALLKRMDKVDLDSIIFLDDKRKELVTKTDDLKAEKNKYSKTKPSEEIIFKMKNLGEELKELEEKLKNVEIELNEKLLELPNTPLDEVISGGKENNKVVYTYSKKPEFKFETKDHIELCKNLGLIDYERAVKMSGSGFWCYTDKGAMLEWALLNYFKDYHYKNGYKFMIPPFLLNEASAYASGHLPKFGEDLFWTQDKLCLNATSEMMINNYHRDEILDESKLPLKYFAYSACFRREAGSYRAEERGMIRGHQFNKIEMFQFVKKEDSSRAFDEMLSHARKLLEGLGLHFQISALAAGDCSDAMAKTYDVEIWIPSMKIYKEVSSASLALDYQARRSNIRYKNKETDRNEFVYTLNASGLATSRVFPALLEQCQRSDGSIKIPKVLHKYLPFKEIK